MKLWMLGAAAALAAGALACGADGSSRLGSGSGAGDVGGVGGGLGGGFGTGGGSGDGCTSDLQAVVDANGNVLMQCPPDQGCSGGRCVPACQAAADAKGSIGCEYWVPYSPFFQNHMTPTSYDGSCHAVFVANTWGRAAQLSVNYNGQPIDVSSFGRIPSGIGPSTQYMPLPASGLPPGQVAVLFLSHKPGAMHGFGSSLECPVTPAVTVDTAVHNSGTGQAFEVTSDTPVTAYDILPYGGAQSYLPSASLLFPRTAWGDNYVVTAPHFSSNGGQQWLLVTSMTNGTTIDVVSPTPLPGGGAAPTVPSNTVTQLTLDAGATVQWMGADPSGAVLQSSAPIGVWTGNTYLRVTSTTSPSGGGQDAAHQQLPPIQALGSEYVGGGVATRLTGMTPESVPYRVTGVVDGTQLSWDPAPPGAPTTLNAGEAVELEISGLFVVRSQDEAHPFSLSQYMPGTPGTTVTGCSPAPPVPGMQCGLGDEEWVVLVPPRQFLQRYAFFVDPTYYTTNLVVTRVRGASGFSDVTIECLGSVSGWQPAGSSGDFEVAHVDLYRAGVGPTPACQTSSHQAESEGAFGIMVWGTDYYASYGYAAGGNVGAINDVVVQPVPK